LGSPGPEWQFNTNGECFVTSCSSSNIITGLGVGQFSRGTASGKSTRYRVGIGTSASDLRDAFNTVYSWSDSTDATRKSRAIYQVFDTAARECMRMEASGSVAMLGFLGAVAVVRQTVGAAATDAATTQTLANNLRTALINLGLAQT